MTVHGESKVSLDWNHLMEELLEINKLQSPSSTRFGCPIFTMWSGVSLPKSWMKLLQLHRNILLPAQWGEGWGEPLSGKGPWFC